MRGTYGMLVLDALGITFDPNAPYDAVERVEVYLKNSGDCSHQMIEVMTCFAERASAIPQSHAILQERSVALLQMLRDYASPCHVTGREEEELDALINTAKKIRSSPHNP